VMVVSGVVMVVFETVLPETERAPAGLDMDQFIALKSFLWITG